MYAIRSYYAVLEHLIHEVGAAEAGGFLADLAAAEGQARNNFV